MEKFKQMDMAQKKRLPGFEIAARNDIVARDSNLLEKMLEGLSDIRKNAYRLKYSRIALGFTEGTGGRSQYSNRTKQLANEIANELKPEKKIEFPQIELENLKEMENENVNDPEPMTTTVIYYIHFFVKHYRQLRQQA